MNRYKELAENTYDLASRDIVVSHIVELRKLIDELTDENRMLKGQVEGLESCLESKPSELYEKLYAENKELKDSAYKTKQYFSEWKKKFGYIDAISFDVVLELLLKIKNSCQTCSKFKDLK